MSVVGGIYSTPCFYPGVNTDEHNYTRGVVVSLGCSILLFSVGIWHHVSDDVTLAIKDSFIEATTFNYGIKRKRKRGCISSLFCKHHSLLMEGRVRGTFPSSCSSGNPRFVWQPKKDKDCMKADVDNFLCRGKIGPLCHLYTFVRSISKVMLLQKLLT